MNENENGFSLIELAVSMAIMVSLAALGFGTMSHAAEAIKANAVEAEQLQQDSYDALISSIN